MPGRNKSAIVTLARQVKALQMQRYGLVQSKYEALYSTEELRHDYPFMICANDFYPGQDLSGTTYSNSGLLMKGGTILNPGATRAAGWAKPQTITALGLDQSFDFNHDRQDDTVSELAYLPMYGAYRFHFTCRYMKPGTKVRVRVTAFKLREAFINSTSKQYALPNAIWAYANMAMKDLGSKNRFNGQLHEILHDRWMTLECKPDAHIYQSNGNPNNMIEGDIAINLSFPPKLLKPSISSVEEHHGSLAYGISQKDLVWFLISTDEVAHTLIAENNFISNVVNVHVSRFVKWRDAAGADAI